MYRMLRGWKIGTSGTLSSVQDAQYSLFMSTEKTQILNRPSEPTFEFTLGEVTTMTQCRTIDTSWTADTMHKWLGKTFRAEFYNNQYVTCVGVAAHYVSQNEAEDFDLTHKGSFRAHWMLMRYVRFATPVEITERQSRP